MASADNTNLGLDNSRYHAESHPIINNYKKLRLLFHEFYYCILDLYHVLIESIAFEEKSHKNS